MNQTKTYVRVLDLLLEKVARAKKIKSNGRMPARSKINIEAMIDQLREWDGAGQKKAMAFADDIGHEELFELLHSMRRWYSGQTMARKILSYRKELMKAMDIEAEDAVGCYRGFKVDKDSPLADKKVGDEFTLTVTRNHGFSSWSTTEAPTNRFSGASKGKVGIIIKLISEKNVVPVLAPPNRTRPWFNAMYEELIGTSFRPTEGEYLISGSGLRVKIVRIKR